MRPAAGTATGADGPRNNKREGRPGAIAPTYAHLSAQARSFKEIGEMKRRDLIRGGIATTAGGLLTLGSSRPAQAAQDGLADEGVGIYTDPSVANQISGFTINRCMVSC